MSQNENEIGVRARFIMEEFDKHVQQYNAKLAQANKATEDFNQKQNAVAGQAAQKAEQNSKRIVDASKKTADEEEKAVQRRSDSLRKFAIASAIIAATVIKGYQTMRDAAKDFGDTEAIAKFDEIDTTLNALKDTFLATGLEVLKLSGFLDTVSNGLMALNQLAILAGAGLAGFAATIKNIAEAGKGYGIEDLGKPGVLEELNAIDFGAIQRKSQEAQRNALQNIITAPERRQAVDREKDAQKERDKNSQKLADYISKIRDLQIKSGESLLNAERDYQDKSASAWQNYIEKTNSIVADGIKKRAEITQTYNDAIASAEKDYQKGAEDAAYNHGKTLANIERDYQDTIRNIQQTYQEDALDAVRNLDAIGLIRARERRDKDLANAAETRDRANQAENENYTRQLGELQRALEDKKREAEDAYQRGLADQRKAEQEATQEAKDALNQQNAEARQAYDQRLADINQSYANERDAAQAQYLNQEAALRAHLEAMRAIMAQYGFDTGGGTTSPVRNSRGGFRRAEGGVDIVNSPTQFTAGEAGPEMAMFIPLNRALPSPVTQTVNHIGDFSHSIDASIKSSMAGFDGRITAAVRKVLAEVLR